MKKKFGSIDILVNNCGGPKPGFFENLSEENWQNGFDQVLMSAVRFTKLTLPKMKENKWGRIINITSISVKQPIDNLLLSMHSEAELQLLQKHSQTRLVNLT
ncbi:MAG: SDR family NAD(P)-dependent oxidoreductase [Ignavibacteriales bacterium]|nr:SDR family NAD(P)-dependent oxidoreductase [Ignavibacteriales bacterium]